MSGGSLNYVYVHVNEAAHRIEGISPLHTAFATHLRLVSEALHDIEWVLSHDYSPGADVKAIQKCLPNWQQATLEEAIKKAGEVMLELKQAMAEAAKAREAQ